MMNNRLLTTTNLFRIKENQVMKPVAIAAKVPAKDGKPELTATINVNFPDVEADAKKAMAEAIQVYGEKAILTNAFANWRVTLQSNIRGGLEKGETAAQIQARLADAKMGVATAGVKVDPKQAFLAQFASATPEQQKALLAELQSAAGKK
jgi:hypothetical protein